MTVSREQLHWGEAAFYLGLDVASGPLSRIIDLDCANPQTRAAVREAVLNNRSYFEKTGRALGVRYALMETLKIRDQRERVLHFVDNELLTLVRHRYSDFDPLLAVYESEDINERLSKNSEAWSKKSSIRVELDKFSDKPAYDDFLLCVWECDIRIADGKLSEWDKMSIARVAETLPPDNPLMNLFSTFDLMQRLRCCALCEAELGQDNVFALRSEARRLLEASA